MQGGLAARTPLAGVAASRHQRVGNTEVSLSDNALQEGGLPDTATQRYLRRLGACIQARKWVGSRTLSEAWAACVVLSDMQWLVTTVAFRRYECARDRWRAKHPGAEHQEYLQKTAAMFRLYRNAFIDSSTCTSCDDVRRVYKCPKVPA